MHYLYPLFNTASDLIDYIYPNVLTSNEYEIGWVSQTKMESRQKTWGTLLQE